MTVPHRVMLSALFDAEIRPHYQRFRAVAAVRTDDRVLDIGCGAGESTRDAARAASRGSVVGVDVSEPLLTLARRLSAGLDNITYEFGDAQTHPFPTAHFDLCISRFGAMFFADPDIAFHNIGQAVRPGGRLVLLVWQLRDRNEWETAVREALAPGRAAPVGGPDPFSLGDRSTVERILRGAGFDAVDFLDVHEPVYYGPDADTATDLVLGLSEPQRLLAEADDADRARARLRELIAAHHTDNGVFFDSRAWIVTAAKAAP